MQEKDETLKKLKRRLKILIALLALLVVFLFLFIITSNNSGVPLSFLVIAFIIALLTFLNAIFLLSRL